MIIIFIVENNCHCAMCAKFCTVLFQSVLPKKVGDKYYHLQFWDEKTHV